MKNVAQLREELAAKRAALNELFKDGYEKLTDDQVKDVQAKNAELTDLGKQFDEAKALADIQDQTRQEHARMSVPVTALGVGSPAPRESGEQPKSLGELFVNSAQYKGRSPVNNVTGAVQADYKTLLTLTGYAVQNIRTGRLEPSATNMNHVADLIPQGRTSANAIVYMEETTFTNAAATVAEGGTKPESALAFTERTTSVRKIATVLPVTDELMNDAPALESYINQRLREMVLLTEDTQLVSGTGVAPQLLGLLNIVGIQTQAKGADPTPDAIYKAMTKIRVNAFLDPDGIILHPNDWQDIRLLRTADGIYIWGNPSEAGPERIWGLNIAQTTAMTENTALVGAFKYATQIFRREDISLAASTEHSTFFIENKVMLRAEERLALVCYRPTALCTVTVI